MGNVNTNPSQQDQQPFSATVPVNGDLTDNTIMTHSPPTTPRATHSPLIFTPQVSLSLSLTFLF